MSHESAERAVMRRYFEEVMNEGDLSVIDAIATPDIEFRIPTIPGGLQGKDAFKQFVSTLRGAFPDLHFTLERAIVEGAMAAGRWTLRGTHRGDFLGVAPTGRTITDHGVDIFQLRDGRIAKIWVAEDAFGLLAQLGALPPRRA